MGHHHHHNEPGHTHSHAPATFNGAFIIAIVANGLFVLFQIVFSYMANSSSLLADAIHNLGDVLGLVLAFLANRLLKRKPTDKATFGMKKTSILAALANGILLVFSCGIIATEAVYRFFSPLDVQAMAVMIVATLGIVINGATAILFLRGKEDLNIRSAYMHLVYDALISVGVVASAALLYYTHWLWIDPLVGLMIAGIILKGTWSLFSDSFRLIIDGVPRGIAIQDVRQLLTGVSGVLDIHDLHVWALSTQENALSVHLRTQTATLSDEQRSGLLHQLKEKYGITHVTIQVEPTDSQCADTCIRSL